MSSGGDADIFIGITVQTDQLAEANQLVIDLTNNLRNLQGTASQVHLQQLGTSFGNISSELAKVKGIISETTPNVTGLTRNMIELSTAGLEFSLPALEKMPGLLSNISRNLGILPSNVKDLWMALGKTVNVGGLIQFGVGIKELGESLGYTDQNLKDFVRNASILREIATKTFGGARLSGKQYEAFITSLAEDAKREVPQIESIMNRMSKAFMGLSAVDKFAIDLEMPKAKVLAHDLGRLGAIQADLTNVTHAMNNAHRLSGPALEQLSQITNLGTEELKANSRAVEDNARKYDMLRDYMRHTRTAIGPLGYAFRDITMQLYWASLGFLFLTMTIIRSEQAQLTAERRANDLAKSYYNIIQLQRDYARTMIEFGANSEEAGKASVQLEMAERDLELQQKSLALAIKSEVLQNLQYYASMIPLTVNTMWLLMTVIGQVRGAYMTLTTEKMRNAIFTMLEAKTTKTASLMQFIDNAAKATGTTVTKASNVVKGKEITLEGIYTAVKTASNYARSIGLGLLTLGIGVAIAYTATTLMMAHAEKEAARQMKEMNIQMEELGSRWGRMSLGAQDASFNIAELNNVVDMTSDVANNATDSLVGLDNTLAGKSVDKSALKAADAMSILNANINRIDTGSAMLKLSEFTGELDSIDEDKRISVDAKVSKDVVTGGIMDNNIANYRMLSNRDTGNRYNVTIIFENVNVRDQNDIDNIAVAIDKKFQHHIHAIGGEV